MCDPDLSPHRSRYHITLFRGRNARRTSMTILFCPNCHRRADRGEIDRKSLRLYQLNLRFAHDKYSQLEMDVLFELNRLPSDQGMPWVGFNLILLKRHLESGFIEVSEIGSGQWIGDIKTTPDVISITPQGRQFIADLETKES